MTNRSLEIVASHFAQGATIVSVDPFGAGNVNDTYMARTEHPEVECFILQRINQQVFRQPRLIAENLRVFTAHAQQKLAAEGPPSDGRRSWETPDILSASSGDDFWEAEEGDFWRALSFIEDAQTHPAILNQDHAREAGYALARFHGLTSDLDPNRLHDTLEGFHVTPQYLAYFDTVLNPGQDKRTNGSERADKTAVNLTDPLVTYGLDFVAQNRHRAAVLEDAKGRGELTQRAIHGDPKVDNILIDNATGKAVSLVDLDTVKPGLVHYDIGDCLRSCCNPLGEETAQFEQVRFETELCQIILEGYLPVVREFFGDADYEYLYDCVWLIAFELGLRFFSDYLAGDVYFKARFPNHNLQRGIVQFKLAESIAAQEGEIRQLIASLR